MRGQSNGRALLREGEVGGFVIGSDVSSVVRGRGGGREDGEATHGAVDQSPARQEGLAEQGGVTGVTGEAGVPGVPVSAIVGHVTWKQTKEKSPKGQC